MNILYINGHPNPKSFHAAIQEAYLSGLGDSHSVRVIELGKVTFDPILRYGYAKRMPHDAFIEQSQTDILWADHIVFAFPVWWGDAPALLKGWIDRVMTPGVAYSLQDAKVGRLLKGKTADLLVTMRGVRPLAWLFGNQAINLFTWNIFGLTGIKKRRTLVLDFVGLLARVDTEKRRANYLRRVRKSAGTLRN